MMEESGTVVELKGKHIAVVHCRKSSFCQHCASMEACHVGDDNRSMLVQAHNVIGARVGDRVRLGVSTRNFLRSSLVLYGIPLAALVFGAILGEVVGMRLENGPDPNLLAAIIGVAFLVGAFLVIRVGSRAIPPETFMPRILEVLPQEEVITEGLKNGD